MQLPGPVTVVVCISHLGHEVAGVPGMQLSVERQTSLLTLLLLQFEEDCPLFVTQRLQLTSQLLWKRERERSVCFWLVTEGDASEQKKNTNCFQTQQLIKWSENMKPSLTLRFNFCPNCEADWRWYTQLFVIRLNLYQTSPAEIKTKFHLCLNRCLLWERECS